MSTGSPSFAQEYYSNLFYYFGIASVNLFKKPNKRHSLLKKTVMDIEYQRSPFPKQKLHKRKWYSNTE